MKRLSLLIVAATLVMCGCNAATHTTQATSNMPVIGPVNEGSWIVTIPPLANLTATGFTSPSLNMCLLETGGCEAPSSATCFQDFTNFGMTTAAAVGGCGVATDLKQPTPNEPFVQTIIMSDNTETSWVRGEAMQFWVVLVICNATCDAQYQLGGLMTETVTASDFELAGPLTCLAGGGGLCTVGDTVTGITIEP
jgi:hypothetical protein